jgi:hypothetical protein
MKFNKPSDINTSGFWMQVHDDLCRLNGNWGVFCESPTFKPFWEESQEFKDALRLLGQQFLDEQYSSYHDLFAIYGANILLFVHKNYDTSPNWRDDIKLLRWDFIQWNLNRIQSLTTLAQ